ncbi:protein-tyrosine phosphatase family protein [Streptomyces cavernae]|uniref:protein-tyrosine phosphatase family protein n=1 Tax=Streptomyces cavernae TaxID=2259034 RepID=UPI001EE419A9|nr:hypothetical protein [Streptomyces cavernae]
MPGRLLPTPEPPGPSMDVISATSGPGVPARRLLRVARRVLIGLVLAYLALWATGALGILALSHWARQETPPPEGARTVRGIQHFQPVDGKLWRGSAPSRRGYVELTWRRFTTVVDLRAERVSASRRAEPRRAGLEVVRLPIRDGQTPTPAQVRRLLDVVRTAPGRVFVHCGPGVGRAGSMAAAYLVRTGQQSPAAAVRLDLAVGPPSIEQLYYGLTLTRTRASRPPVAVSVVSRLVDAPRRLWSWL